jgi:O-antigen/teichoic acid export membrane protein
MSVLRGNILANYGAQIYVTLIGFITLPLYVRYMGAEAYGLVGFFAMLQAWFSLLDIGLTHTMLRETARFRGGATDMLSYRRLVRSLEVVFFLVALIGGGTMFAASGYIALEWLKPTELAPSEVRVAVQIMAVIIASRWVSGLYRGAISGSERLIWLSGYNSLIATIRYLGVLPVLMFVDASPTIFFTCQFCVAVLELLGLIFYTYHILPTIPDGTTVPWSLASLKPVLKFSLTIAFTSSVWVLVTQADKLVLSKLLPLADYGYYTLAVLVASSVGVTAGPIVGAVMPRMTRLEAAGDQAGLISLYRQSTQVVSIVAGAIAATIAFCAEPLLWGWTGDKFIAKQTAPILVLYAVGNSFLALSAFPYYLQYAKGNLRMHWVGQIVFAALLIPAIIWAASHYGGIGAGYVWMVTNLVYLLIWAPIVHKCFAPQIVKDWLIEDVATIFIAISACVYILSQLISPDTTRALQISQVAGIGISALFVGTLASSTMRGRLRVWLKRRLIAEGDNI